MSERISLNCPHCQYSRVIPRSVIPEGARRANCPRCKQSFPLDDENMREEEPASAPSPPSVPAPDNSPPASPPLPAAPHPSPRTLRFAFTGSARDYFGIWIVNTLLKILSMGIYSAWAKVRGRCFFYGSTILDGHSFQYLADPMALFKGWLIAAAALILYGVANRFSPALSMVIALIIFLAFPWLLVRSRIFNSVNSSYRNIRFSFKPDYRQAYFVFAGLAILSALTAGLLTPYMLFRQKKFMVENTGYGATPFSFSATAKDFYILVFKIVLAVILVFMLIGALSAMMGGLPPAGTTGGIRAAMSGVMIVISLAMVQVYFVALVYFQTAMTNLVWNGTRMGKDSFRSTLRTRDMALLFVTNALAIMCSFGLLIPWATVRLARYRFEHLELVTVAGLDGVVAAAGGDAAVSATGEEIGDLFDLPIDVAF